MKNFDQFLAETYPTLGKTHPQADSALEAWNFQETQYKKELHDMAGKIQSAQLRAEVAERKLNNIETDLYEMVSALLAMDGRGCPVPTHTLLEIRKRHKLSEEP